ncbi:MAG: hypothetical protein GX604_02665 [Actinobacteria bacterium]|nr:hypothetical protein [Actinomycetota bacterium]
MGLRREDKSVWEKRVAVTPQDAGTLRKAGIDVVVQPSSLRIFSDEEFLAVGALVQEDLGACPIEIGIKEMKPETFRQGGTYVFFSHTIKGQSYNMPMLKRLMDLGCNLIDYEKVTDENGKRLIFFGNFAGMAGMMETLVALERRMAWEGMATPLAALKRPLEYHNLEEAKEAVRVVGDGIRTEGFLPELAPVVCGFAGYGNVARGAWEILDLLPVEEVPPGRLAELIERGDASRHCVYKVVFREEDTAEPLQAAAAFRLQDYYQRPDRYRGVFERYVPYLTMLVNCIYWEDKYPRLITKKGLRQQWECGSQRLKVIGDISADLEGAVECTVRITDPGAPYFVYDPLTGGVSGGVEGRGVVVMSVDILPSELPRDASVYFSGVLRRFIPALVHADYSVSFGDLDLPPEIKRAVIVYHGRLTPDFEYMEQFL